jgi:hypothetical protein
MVDEAGGDVDDVTTGALREHVPNDGLGDVEEAGQVHGHDRLVVVERVVREWLADENPCRVDQGVDPTEPIDCLLHHPLSGPDFRDVTLHGEDVVVI